MSEKAGFLVETALQLGFTEEWCDEGERVLHYTCTLDQLLEFARRIETAAPHSERGGNTTKPLFENT